MWKTDVLDLVHSGEFSRAETALASLAEGERASHAVVIDSIVDIMRRVRSEFAVGDEEGFRQIRERVPSATDEQIEKWIASRLIETMSIDGQRRWFNRAARNFTLLGGELFAQRNDSTRAAECQRLQKYSAAVQESRPDAVGVRNWHKAKITFTLDVDSGAVPAGEWVRVWLPFPIYNGRQRNIALTASSHPVRMSWGSVHNTVYMETMVPQGEGLHFEITYTYDVGAQIFAREELLERLQPYDTASQEYMTYTSGESPNIVVDEAMRQLALKIVGGESNPVLQAGKIYDWIVERFPWASARDYSTIPCIPRYVLEEGHGDCGQVTLLNISLLRSIGIPARWESGWMLHPGAKGLHDWGEVYFEGIGWVPCDVSMGRTTRGSAIADYYKTSTDIYRLATNRGVNGEFSPEKIYIRCDEVDSQLGEVEWRGGNVAGDKWKAALTIDSFEPIASSN